MWALHRRQGTRMARPRTRPASSSWRASTAASSGTVLVCRVTFASLGEHHQLGQIVVGADDVADDVALGGDDVQRRHLERAAVPDHEVRPVRARHREALVLRSLLGNEVRTTSAPPFVSCCTASTWPPSATTVWCAPSCSASFRASGLRSTTMMLVAVSAPGTGCRCGRVRQHR